MLNGIADQCRKWVIGAVLVVIGGLCAPPWVMAGGGEPIVIRVPGTLHDPTLPRAAKWMDERRRRRVKSPTSSKKTTMSSSASHPSGRT